VTSRTVLTFDYGTKSIGVAVGQEFTGTASLLSALKAQDGTPDWQQLEKLINDWQPQLLLVGLPLNMDGTEQPFTARVRKFANRLHGRFGLPVTLQDERLTTAEARSQLFAEGGYKKLAKDKIDSFSAKLIFESWYEQHA
jgi:putative holliday junction resolvase